MCLNENCSLALTEISGHMSPPKSTHSQHSRTSPTKTALNTLEFRYTSPDSNCIRTIPSLSIVAASLY